MARKLLGFFFFFYAGLASSIPLQTWPDWVATAPFIAKQVPPAALVARCQGLNLLCVMEVDQTTGRLPVDAIVNIIFPYSGPTGAPVPGEAAYVAGVDQNGDLRGLLTDTNGRLQIDGTADNDFAGPTGDPVPAEAGYVAGVDGNGDLQGLAVDTSGQLQIDVLSSALPAGAATEAKQDSEIALLTTIDSDTGAIATDTATIAGDTTSIDAKTPALGQTTMANSVPVAIASDQSPVDVDITTADVDIRDLDYTTDSVTAHQGGTWDINDISGTISLPTGAATEAKQEDILTEMGVAIAAIYSGQLFGVSDKVNLNYSSTNVTTGAYVEIIASTAADISRLTVFEGSGQGMILAVGASSAEQDYLYIPPGGFDGPVSVVISSGTRLSIKAINATASSGRFIANFMGAP